MKEYNVPTLPRIALSLIVAMGIASTSIILNPGYDGVEYAFFDSTWPALIAFPVATLYLVELMAIRHAYKIEIDQQSPSHALSWTLRVIVAVLIAASYHLYNWDLYKICYLTGYGMCWGGLLFTLRLNYYRVKDWDYIDEGNDGSIWDEAFFRLFGKKGGEIAIATLFTLMILFAIAYLKQ